eukprot:2995334-Pleurochrysis_carterae.AAC.1
MRIRETARLQSAESGLAGRNMTDRSGLSGGGPEDAVLATKGDRGREGSEQASAAGASGETERVLAEEKWVAERRRAGKEIRSWPGGADRCSRDDSLNRG